MEPIKVKSKADLRDYCKIAYKKQYSARNMIMLMVLFLVLQVFVFDPRFNWVYEFVVVGVVLVFYGMLVPLILYVSCRRDMQLPLMQETLDYTITEKEIDLQGATVSAVSKWQYIKKAIENDRYFVLFTTNKAMHYLPKAGFASVNDVDRFRDIVRMNRVKANFN